MARFWDSRCSRRRSSPRSGNIQRWSPLACPLTFEPLDDRRLLAGSYQFPETNHRSRKYIWQS